MGADVRVKYRGEYVEGKVIAVSEQDGKQGAVRRWTVRFNDGYVRQYSRKQLKQILVRYIYNFKY